jgi:hypothetical protein
MKFKVAAAIASALMLAGCNNTPPNTDPKAGVVWTVPNKTAWKECSGTTMLYGQANRGAPAGRWVTATVANSTECK